MKATILSDNIGTETLCGEWGLSFYITYAGKTVLLDMGSSRLFAENAKKLGVDLAQVDFAVLSHAHYDHANGMAEFFENNGKAKLYVRKSCADDCYKRLGLFYAYIGTPKGALRRYSERIVRLDGDFSPADGIWIIGHKTDGLAETGKREKMFRRGGLRMRPDDFSHEQSLVFDTEKGLVIFNSCSHAGADVIIREIRKTFPERPVFAMVGGFHLYNKSEDFVRAFAKRVKDTGIQIIYTGHCTGDASYRILEKELPGMVHQFHAGLQMDF